MRPGDVVVHPQQGRPMNSTVAIALVIAAAFIIALFIIL